MIVINTISGDAYTEYYDTTYINIDEDFMWYICLN